MSVGLLVGHVLDQVDSANLQQQPQNDWFFINRSVFFQLSSASWASHLAVSKIKPPGL